MWERNISQYPPICTLTGDGIYNLGICPNRESNPQPFDWDDALTNWATGPGHMDESYFYNPRVDISNWFKKIKKIWT